MSLFKYKDKAKYIKTGYCFSHHVDSKERIHFYWLLSHVTFILPSW